ncbi:MAG TPA: carbonic anhydrase [Chryseolinea sp.]|nr:carbonic anhydrase [Chryseolinea sp.]
MTSKEKMFLESKAWVLEKLSLDKTYFDRLSGMHAPNILWIGSIDNLVSFREIINADPGDVLVYRNMGVQVRGDDISLMATIQDAVEISKVEYIVVCGYSHCSGIQDVVLGNDDRPYVKRWLGDLHDLYENRSDEFQDMDFEQRTKRLCELNIRAQIIKLSQLDVIQKAWEKGNDPILLGWYFDLNIGALKEIFSMESNYKLKQVASVA